MCEKRETGDEARFNLVPWGGGELVASLGPSLSFSCAVGMRLHQSLQVLGLLHNNNYGHFAFILHHHMQILGGEA